MDLSAIKSKLDEIDRTPSSAAEGGHPSLKAKALIRWRETVMGEAKKSELIESTISQFNQAHAALKAELNNSTYSGCDKPGLTLRLLDELDVPLTFNNPTDLYRIIQGVPVTEMEELFSRESFKIAFLTEINLIENLVIFIMETASDKLPTILTQIKNELSQTVIQSPEDLATLLISLQVEKVSIVAKSLKSDLFRFLLSNRGRGLEPVLKHLSPEKRTAVYEVMKDDLPTCIQSASDPVNALMHLYPEQMTALCQAMKDQLPILIQTADDFVGILYFLNSNQKHSVYEAMKDKLPTLIKTADDFVGLLHYLDSNQQNSAYEAMKDKLPTLINTIYQFQAAFFNFSPEQQKVILKQMAPFISGPKLIKWLDNADSETRQLMILDALKDELPDIVLNQPSIQEIMQKGALATMIACFNVTTDFFNAIHAPQIDGLLDASVQETLNQVSKYMSVEEAEELEKAVYERTKVKNGSSSEDDKAIASGSSKEMSANDNYRKSML